MYLLANFRIKYSVLATACFPCEELKNKKKYFSESGHDGTRRACEIF